MINCITMVGRLTKDVEIQVTGSGTTIGKFSLANNRWTPQGDQVTFIDCVAFGKTADNMHIFTHKGMLVGVIGRLQTSSYTGKDGVKRTYTEIVANEVHFLERKAEERKTETQPASKKAMTDEFGGGLEIADEDLPF